MIPGLTWLTPPQDASLSRLAQPCFLDSTRGTGSSSQAWSLWKCAVHSGWGNMALNGMGSLKGSFFSMVNINAIGWVSRWETWATEDLWYGELTMSYRRIFSPSVGGSPELQCHPKVNCNLSWISFLAPSWRKWEGNKEKWTSYLSLH